jgi:exopolyphosphatase / guanosine-5'-triphosphate,3'-diphosphate pyrophosphatase
VAPRRIAVLDLGTNSTRLLVADVQGGRLAELERRTTVTRLGEGVDATGLLGVDAIARVTEAVAGYRAHIDRLGAAEVVAIATSALRDAGNGPAFHRTLQERFDIDARTISGEEEARLTFRGATGGRPREEAETMVIDIGGGSTEYVVGRPGQDPSFYVSTRMGSVRHTERHLGGDPPDPGEIAALSQDAERIVRSELPDAVRERVRRGVAVAGTATSLAAIDLELDPYDPDRVHGHRLSLAACERILDLLAALPLAERRKVTGLHPDRAPTIVAGATILRESIRACGLADVEISEADILHGAALAAAESDNKG